jgi:hypothetical protein
MMLLLIVALAGGLIAGVIASSRGLSFGGYFLLGFLLPLIGIVVAAVAQPSKLRQLTAAPAAGWWPDPTGRFDRRYYDGHGWTRHVTRDADKRQLEDPI